MVYFLRLILVQCSWALVVCGFLQRKLNQRIPVLNGKLIALMDTVISTDVDRVWIPGPHSARVEDVVDYLKRALSCSSNRQVRCSFHLDSRCTESVREDRLPLLPNAGHHTELGCQAATKHWFHEQNLRDIPRRASTSSLFRITHSRRQIEKSSRRAIRILSGTIQLQSETLP